LCATTTPPTLCDNSVYDARMPVITAIATDEVDPPESPVVIVGCGTAGTAFALEFVKHSSSPIVIIEAGGEAVGRGGRRFMDVAVADNMWPGVRMQCVEDGPIQSYMQARVVGGGSAVNGMLDTIATGRIAYDPKAVGSVDKMLALRSGKVGQVGRALLTLGGQVYHLNQDSSGRVDRVSAMQELFESGRATLVRGNATSVVIKDGRAVGVIVDGEEISASDVVMCAGAVGTARILRATDLPARVRTLVGAILSDHPALSFTLHLREPASADVLDALVAKWGPVRPKAIVIRESPTELSEKYSGWRPNLDSGGAFLDGYVLGVERASADRPDLGLLTAILPTPWSVGSLGSEDPSLLRPAMLSHENDMLRMRTLVRRLVEISMSPEVAAVASHVTVDEIGTRVTEIALLPDELLDDWIRAHLTPVSHACGTCAALVHEDLVPFARREPWKGMRGVTVRASGPKWVPARYRRKRLISEIYEVPWPRGYGLRDQTGRPKYAGAGAVSGVPGLSIVDSSAIFPVPAEGLNALVVSIAKEEGARFARLHLARRGRGL
jgi:GMC oxidoreductase